MWGQGSKFATLVKSGIETLGKMIMLQMYTLVRHVLQSQPHQQTIVTMALFYYNHQNLLRFSFLPKKFQSQCGFNNNNPNLPGKETEGFCRL